MKKISYLAFKPGPGLSSKHLQMIISAYLPAGKEPPSERWLVDIGHGDKLSCHVSTPVAWKEEDNTIVLVHGMGGSASSKYMVRMARKLYARHDKVVRVNLRNCGSGHGLSKLPYCAGNSRDLHKVLVVLKEKHPHSGIQLVGYSLGGSIALKLAGEHGIESRGFVKKFMAVCPPLDLGQCIEAISRKENRLYHAYYLRSILKQGQPWVSKKISSLFEFDNQITGPLWGYANAKEYYQKCSCIHYLNTIDAETHVLLSCDDPFVPLSSLDGDGISISHHVKIWATNTGSHMGFLGSFSPGKFHWMDSLLLQWTI